MLFAISILYSIKRGTQVFLVGIDSLPKCYSGKHFLSPRAQIALLFGPTTISASRELDRQIARLIKDARPDGSRSDHQIPLPRESSATVVYSNFIGVKWEKDFPTVAKLDTPSTKYVGVKR